MTEEQNAINMLVAEIGHIAAIEAMAAMAEYEATVSTGDGRHGEAGAFREDAEILRRCAESLLRA